MLVHIFLDLKIADNKNVADVNKVTAKIFSNFLFLRVFPD